MNAIPYTYRTLTSRITTRPKNKQAIALYSRTIAGWLESNTYNRADRVYDQLLLTCCKNWLLEHNPVFHRNDIENYLKIDHPLSLLHLKDENGKEKRLNN